MSWTRLRGRLLHPELLAPLALLLLVVVFLARVLFGGMVLVPGDVLFTFPPWKAYAGEFGVAFPHNELLSDLLLENLAWKNFAHEALAQGSLPLWNPYIFSGMPFLAAGQAGVLYPLGLFFYLMPPAWAYGWFAALHFFLGGLLMYLYLRLIGANPTGGLLSALAFVFSSLMVVSVIWPMVISTVIWLPLLLILVELIIRNQEKGTPSQTLPLSLAGGLVIGVVLLAGHLEYSFYVLFSILFYSLARLLVYMRHGGSMGGLGRILAALAGMALLGVALAGAQLLPFMELARENFRSGLTTYQEVIGYALPRKQALSFLMPDFFGNPSHHTYFDFLDWQARDVVGAKDVDGHARPYPFWGVKNYVEAASYVGVLPLALALAALLLRRDRYTWTFAAYALFSLLLAFGTPLYRVFWSLPAFDQLHTPFRWLFPYTFSAAVLAGLGATSISERAPNRRPSLPLAVAAVLGGLLLAALALGRWLVGPTLGLAERLLAGSQALSAAFSSPQMLYSYQFRNFLVLGLLLAGGGVVLALGRRTPRGRACLLTLVAADLFFFGYGYNAAADPRLLDFTPPAIRFLQEDKELFRVASFNPEDTLAPNTAMLAGLQDARGYDSIILRQYVGFWGLMEEPHGLPYNRIHKLLRQESLQSPFLDLMNVKYILTTQPLELPGLEEAYGGEIRIYKNSDYLPRAFLVSQARPARSREEALRLLAQSPSDVRRAVVLETEEELPPTPSLMEGYTPARISGYRANEVVVEVDAPQPGYVVLTDNYFLGWRAWVDGREVRLYRADSTFRSVRVETGAHTVAFRYDPDSFKMGLLASFLGIMALVVGMGYWSWRRLAASLGSASTVQRIAKNISVPMAVQLLNKLVDFAFAIFMLRLLGPLNAGKYAFAVVLVGYFAVFSDFGLGTLLTREVARAKGQANRYLSNTAVLRLFLSVLSVPLLLGLLGLYAWRFDLAPDAAWTSLLLMASLFPSGLAAALSSVFSAHERMELPAAVSLVSNLLKVALGVGVLIAGWGIVGLGLVSFVVSGVTALIFYRLLTRTFFRPSLEIDGPFQRQMLRTSYPLMINNFLSTIFFRIDVMLLKPMQGDLVNGWYTTAYKFVDGLVLIPSLFTLAVFPILSRYAEAGRETLLWAYTLSLRALLLLGLPLTVGITLLADRIVHLFFGPDFAPSAVALRILIWFLPFSFINSLTQYVLIAVNQQRFLTLAFLVGAAFNILANLALIPAYSYLGASLTTVLSEIVLLVPFLYAVWRHVGRVPLLEISWRPVLASLAMGGILWWLRPLNLAFLVVIGALAYAAALVLLRTFNEEDRALARRLLGR